MDIALVVDISAEIDEASEMLEMLQLLVYGLPVARNHVRIALVVYTRTTVIRFYLNTYFDKSKVDSTPR